jgi:multiple sugar transport system permease protein/putative chitobiose transport system permease protein
MAASSANAPATADVVFGDSVGKQRARERRQTRAVGGRLAAIGGRVLLYALMLLLVAVVVVPLWWIVVSSFTTRETVWANALPFSWRALWPQEFTMAAYQTVFQRGYGQAVVNTIGVGFATVVLTIAVAACAGFAFARFEFVGKGPLWVLVLVSLMVPWEATAIPAYTLVNGLGWTNTWFALIVPAVANGTAIFLFRQFFAEIPQDLLDAARVDGASWPRVLANIVLPLAMPVTITAAILVFLGQWNAFFWPMLVASDPDYRMVQVAVSILGVNQELTNWDQLFAAATIAATVPLLLVLPLQRFYVGSIAGSGIKG